MDPKTIFITLMTTLTLALIPWLIAQPALKHMPNKQTKRARRIYRGVTAGAAVALTAASIPPLGPWTYLIAVGSAVFLTGHWTAFARTPRGKAQLGSARAWQQREDDREADKYKIPPGGW